MKNAETESVIAESLPDEERSGCASTGRHRHEKTQLVHHLSHRLFFSSLSPTFFFLRELLLLCLVTLTRRLPLLLLFLLDPLPTFALDDKTSAILSVTSPLRLFIFD